MNNITIWKREDQNTTPRGIGNLPSYSIDKPQTSGFEMVWAEPIECEIPNGYTVAESVCGTMEMYDKHNVRQEIVDYRGHPAIVVDKYDGCAAYKRLDKGAEN